MLFRSPMIDESFLGKGSYSEWFKDKFSGFHEFLRSEERRVGKECA